MTMCKGLTRLTWVGVLVLALLALPSLAQATSVTVGVGAEATTLDPRHATDVASANITTLVYAPLVVWDDSLEIVPVVAEGIDNPDDQTYIFHLRRGITFHDGVELTAADVKYTYDTLRDPDFGAANIGFYRDIESIDTPDDYTVVIRLEQPNAPFIYYLNVGIVPMHYTEEHGADHLAQAPLGAGPFEFVEWRTGEHLRLAANDNWFEGRPQIDELVFRPIPDVITRTVELEVGGVHAIDNIDPLDVTRLEDDPGVDVMRQPDTGFDYIGMHNGKAPFDDVRVRQAIAHMIPREDIVEHVLHGIGLAAYSPIIPQSWAHEPEVARFDYDPARAQELLAAAGYGDGFPVTLDLSENPIRRQMAEIMQQELAQIGIDVTIREREWGAFYQSVLDGDVTMFILGWRAQTDPDRGLYRQFHTRNWAPAGANRQQYSNPRVDELLDEARTVTDVDRRQELYSEAQKIIVEEASYAYIFYPESVAGQSPSLQNFTYDPYFYFRGLKDARIE